MKGGTTFRWVYMRKFRFRRLRYQVEKEFNKDGGQQKQNMQFWALY